MRPGEIRLEFQRPQKAGFGFAQPMLRPVQRAQIVVHERVARLYADGALDELERSLVIARLMAQLGKQVQRIGMIRRELQPLPVKRIGLLQASRLMMLEGGLDVLGYVAPATLRAVSFARQQRLYFLPLPQGQGSLRLGSALMVAWSMAMPQLAQKILHQRVAVFGEYRFGMELHALDGELAVAHAHDLSVVALGGDLQAIRQTGALDHQ